jgi:hypothetical protein
MAGVVTGPEPGPLADEAARLVTAAQEWLHRVVGESDGPRIATGAPECCWCPVCQLIATLRGDRPELVERLAEAQTALAGVLRALAKPAGREPTAEQAAGASAEQTAGSKPKTGRGRVQRIPLDEDRAEPPRRG